MGMIEALRKVIQRLHYPLELMLSAFAGRQRTR